MSLTEKRNRIIRGGENRKKEKKKKRCLFVKRTGGRKGRWERRRRKADEVMSYAKRRGIGREVQDSFPGQTGTNNYVNATKAAVNCICNHKS
jgi:hypothetical protein